MAVKPTKFISDVLTRKQFIKTDLHDNVLFRVSSSNGTGHGSVSSSLPITASGLFIDGDTYFSGTIHAKKFHVTEITSSVYYEDSLSASINALQDVSASNAISGNMLAWDGINWVGTSNFSGEVSGNLYGTASHAIEADNALSSSYAISATHALDSENAVSASYALTAAYALNIPPQITTLSGLQDVYINPNAGDVLVWDGTKWVSSRSLDVYGTFSGSLHGYLNGSASYALTAAYALNIPDQIKSINDLTDVSASYAVSGNILKYDGENWIASEVNGVGVSRQDYVGLRFNATGTFNTQDVIELRLPQTFTVESINYINFNLLIKEEPTSNWRNDIASVELKASGSSVYAVISAPENIYEYSFNAINDNPNVVNTSVIVQEYSDLQVNGNLILSGSPLNSLGGGTASYNVATVLSTIDSRFAALIENYSKLSETHYGYFSINGTKEIELDNFTASDLEHVYLDVMVKQSGSSYYTNDLISVRLYENMATNKLHVLLDAAGLSSNDKYKVIATKQTGSLF